MCELDPEAVKRATANNDARVMPTSLMGEVANLFDAAIKRERAKQPKCQRNPDDDPPPRRAA